MQDYYKLQKDAVSAEYLNPPEDLSRYIEAQDKIFGMIDGKPVSYHELAVREFQRGCKINHYIWFILPQIEGLGHSSMCKKYGVPGLKGAICYLQNDLLRSRLLEVVQCLLNLDCDDLLRVMWSVDCYKTRSSCTLFFMAALKLYGEDSVEARTFLALIKKYFVRIGMDDLTLKILRIHGEITDEECSRWYE